jgi:hypothetical protein
MMPVTLDNVLGRMTDLSEEAVDHTFLGMLYGPSGTGKTTLSMWLAQNLISDTGRIAYVDSAQGYVSLENTPSLLENSTRLAFSEYGELVVLADAIKKKTKKGGIEFGKFEVVVIDELDSIVGDVLDVVVREKNGTLAGQATPEIEGKDYAPMGALIMQAIKNFQRLGVHVILVAHDKEKKDHRAVTVKFPAINPKLKDMVMGLMHVVAYTSSEIKGNVANPTYARSIQAQPTALVEAKTRIGALQSPIKMDHEQFVDAVVSWISPGGSMAEDLSREEEQVADLEPDELPTDGIPVAELEADDEPAFVGSDE